MTLSALAEQAGVAKSTVSLIERGQGNPSIDTVWALASALGVPFTSLFHDEPPADDVAVVREDDGSVIAIEDAGLEAEGLVARHMLTRSGGALIEIYTLVFRPPAHLPRPQRSGAARLGARISAALRRLSAPLARIRRAERRVQPSWRSSSTATSNRSATAP